MSNLSYLEHIDLSSTGMDGTISSTVQMSNLLVFQVFNSKLSGTIPTEIGSWTKLGKWMTDSTTRSLALLIICKDMFGPILSINKLTIMLASSL
jgi:hypothetical protein